VLGLAHVLVLLAAPVLVVGLINRTRALWAGRKGPPLLQLAFDLRRLVRKVPVYSDVTTAIFRVAPVVVLASALVAGGLVPLLGGWAPLSFAYDFVFVAYIAAAGRVALLLAALDTGSAFEGMGASRAATYGAIAEPTLLLVLGTLAAVTGRTSFAELLAVSRRGPAQLLVTAACALALAVILQIEASRGPVDDPATHIELTMIHEAMILDHSGPDLAAVQYGSAVRLTSLAGLLATLLNPLAGRGPTALAAAVNLALIGVIAVAVGCVESLVARLKLRAVPALALMALVAALIALLVMVGSQPAGT
jgi:formate hydrogenlyase subunit 4